VRATTQWARVFLLVAVLLGVLAMHATVAPVGEGPCAARTVHAHGGEPTTAPVGHSEHNDCDRSSGAHHLLHLCLAVMAAVLLLGLAFAVAISIRRHDSGGQTPIQVVRTLARPPPRTAVRLAQLCVLRN
jgi:ABC-type Fe3+ transport system permease subunit